MRWLDASRETRTVALAAVAALAGVACNDTDLSAPDAEVGIRDSGPVTDDATESGNGETGADGTAVDTGDGGAPADDVGEPPNAAFYVLEPAANHAHRPGDESRRIERLTEISFLSADGSFALGLSALVFPFEVTYMHLAEEEFRWTPSTGVVGLGFPAEFAGDDPRVVRVETKLISADGSALVGSCSDDQSRKALFLWTKASGISSLSPTFGPDFVAGGVSAGGEVVVGTPYSASRRGEQAVRWTAANGFSSLGALPGQVQSWARAVSSDGAMIIGSAEFADGSQPVRASEVFRWTAATGMVGIGRLPGSDFCASYFVNADAASVVGTCWDAARKVQEVFRWTETSEMRGLGQLDGYASPYPGIATADGATIIVYASRSGGPAQLFRWTEATGIVSLGVLAGYDACTATGMSADGSVVVGTCWGNADGGSMGAAFRWTQSSGMVGLGWLPHHTKSRADGVSDDGTLVVGSSQAANSNPPSESVMWDANGGPHSIAAELGAAGIDLHGFRLTAASKHRRLTQGGRNLIAGTGSNAEGERRAWIARLP